MATQTLRWITSGAGLIGISILTLSGWLFDWPWHAVFLGDAFLAVVLLAATGAARAADRFQQLLLREATESGETARALAADRARRETATEWRGRGEASEMRIAELSRDLSDVRRQLEEERELVHGLNSGLASLAVGDTSFRLVREYTGEKAKIRRDFNDAIERLSRVFSGIAISSAKIEDTSREMFDGAEALSKRVESQAASLKDTALAMDRVSTKARHTTDSAQEANRLAGKMTDSAAGGRQAVVEAVEAMAKIQRSAEEITTIISMVDEISTQTNLLALNAAVEAARAGSVGKGFAVVASEVRQLAKRSSESSRAIKMLVGTSVDQVVDGVERVNRAGQRLDEIVAEINSLNKLVGGISEASADQTAAIGQIKESVDLLDKTTQENAHLARVSNDSAEGLLVESGALNKQISFFRASGHDVPFADTVRDAAERIGKLFERALAEEKTDMAALFDDGYKPIAGTNPQQYTTRFLSLTDQLLPPIQETILGSDDRIAFCAAVDRNGYLPTHNAIYSKPQGSDPVWNTANSRNRRIFNDVVGLGAARSTAPYYLQTYERDMGGGKTMVIKDISAPIFVSGRHWGGLRIGFKM